LSTADAFESPVPVTMNFYSCLKRFGFFLTSLEADVLSRLSKCARFAGRYPIAKTPAAMQPNATPGAGPVDVAFFSKEGFSNSPKHSQQDHLLDIWQETKIGAP